VRFPGRQVLVGLLNASMGLPPVIVGLVIYLLLSRSGPLGPLGLLFTPAAMVAAQAVLVTPLIAAAGWGMEPGPRFDPGAKDAQDRSIATLGILLAAGADVNARITDVKSRTARMGRGSTLPERGGQSALFGAVQWAWPRVVQYLIDHGAEVAVVDDRKVSPLDAALGKAGSADNHPSPEVAKVLQAAIGH